MEKAQQILQKNISNPSVALHSLQSPDYEINSCLIGKFIGQSLQLYGIGNLHLILTRSGQLSQILRSLDMEVQTVTGPFYPQDLLFVTNTKLLDNPGLSEVKESLLGGDIDTSEQVILKHHLPLAFLIQKPDARSAPAILSTLPTAAPGAGFSKKILLIPIIIALVAFAGKQLTTNYSYANQQNQLEDMVVKSEGILPLNPDSAIQTAKEAQELLTKLKSQKKEDWQDDIDSRLTRILAQKKTTVKDITPTTRLVSTPSPTKSFGDASLFFDLTTVSTSSNFSRLTGSQNQLYLLDSSNKRLDLLNLDTKKSELFLRSNLLEQMQNLLYTPSGLFASSANTIYKLDRVGANAQIKLDTEGQTISPSYLSFWNNALYILDTQNRQIYKSMPNTRGFDKPVPWLKSGQRLDSDASVMTIDTNPYVLSKSSLVTQYSKGEKTAFVLKGATGIDTPTFLLTPTGSGKIIISSANKVYIFDKTGQIQKTYTLGDAIPLDMTFYASSLYILESSQKILTLPL